MTTDHLLKLLSESLRVHDINALYVILLKYNGIVSEVKEVDSNIYVVKVLSQEQMRYSSSVGWKDLSPINPIDIVLSPKDI